MINPIKYILKIHDSLWADAFYSEREISGRKSNWKLNAFFKVSLAHLFNFVTLFGILYFLGFRMTDYFVNYIYSIIPSKVLSKLVIGFSFFILPAYAFSYFTVFYKKRYKYILDNYKYRKGKLLTIYIISTILFFWGFIILRYFLTKD